MEKKRIPLWLSIVSLILVVGSIVWTAVTMVKWLDMGLLSVESALNWILTILALIAVFIYAAYGYKKSSAAYFLAFIWLYAITTFIGGFAIVTVPSASPALFVAFDMVQFGMLSVLAIAKDLGKKSFVLGGIILLVNVGRVILSFVSWGMLVPAVAANLILSVILCIMIYAKYADKASRGTT